MDPRGDRARVLDLDDFSRTGREMFEKWLGASLADHLMEGLRKAGLETTT